MTNTHNNRRMILTAAGVLAFGLGAYGLGRYSASVWPAFLPLGVWLTRRPSWKLPLVVVLAMFQGLFLHLFAHAYELQ